MAKRKIRHALVQYSVKDGDKTRFETAFRNQIVDIPDDQVDRLDVLGATVEPDEDLPRPGRMLALPETAGDAEILNWVMGASNEEIENLVRERPAMAGRIEAAHAAVQERFQEQNLHLGGLKEIAEEAEADLIGGTVPTQEPGTPPAPSPAREEALTPEAADQIVAGKATDVANYISENPQSAGVILEAEDRRATAAKEDVRVTIVKAAEAAAGFTAQ